MEFKFREVDDKPPAPAPAPAPATVTANAMFSSQPSSFTGFPDPKMLGGYMGRRYPDPMGEPNDFHIGEVSHREILKEQIREEIMLEEMVMRRKLEAEVRREMALEREIAMRKAAEMGLPLDEWKSKLSESRFPAISPYGSRWALGAAGCSDGLPLQYPRLPDVPRLPEVKETEPVYKTPESCNRVIVLPRPEVTLSGAKRKAESQPATDADRTPPSSLRKEVEEDWSCAMCRFSSYSEFGLNRHLQSMKHKETEANLKARNPRKKFRDATMSVGRTSNPESSKRNQTSNGVATRVEEKSFRVDKTGDQSGHEDVEIESSKSKTSEQPLMNEAEEGKQQENRNQTVERVAPVVFESGNKKFRFWCEMCGVGAFTECVMNDHKKGRKHMERLENSKRNNEDYPTVATTDSTGSYNNNSYHHNHHRNSYSNYRTY